MKSDRFNALLIHFLLWFSTLGILVGSLFLPWAYGRAVLGLASERAFLYQSSELHMVSILVPIIIGLVLISGLYGLRSGKYFVIGILNGLMGLGTIGLGYHVWLQIDAKDIHFLGLSPFKLAEVYPDIGMLFLFMAGFLWAMDGLVCLFIGKPDR